MTSSLKAGNSLPVCLFLNFGILAYFFFVSCHRQICPGAESKTRNGWGALFAEAPGIFWEAVRLVSLVCVVSPGYMHVAHTPGRLSNSANSTKPCSTRTECVRLQCKHPLPKALTFRIKWSAALRVYLLLHLHCEAWLYSVDCSNGLQ